MMRDVGYAFTSSSSGPVAPPSAGRPNAKTSVLGESIAGSAPTDHFPASESCVKDVNESPLPGFESAAASTSTTSGVFIRERTRSTGAPAGTPEPSTEGSAPGPGSEGYVESSASAWAPLPLPFFARGAGVGGLRGTGGAPGRPGARTPPLPPSTSSSRKRSSTVW